MRTIECRQDGRLSGFALLGQPSRETAVYLQGFGIHSPGGRTGDCLLDTMIAYCRAAGARRLHLGYSPSDSLAAFKRKWGGRTELPTYREAFYASDAGIAARIREKTFLWSSRLVDQGEA